MDDSMLVCVTKADGMLVVSVMIFEVMVERDTRADGYSLGSDSSRDARDLISNRRPLFIVGCGCAYRYRYK